MTAGTSAALPDDAVLALRELSIVPDGGQFIVGDPATAAYVALPRVGVQVLELLDAGATIAQAREQARAFAGEDVAVDDFAQSLIELGFAKRDDPPTRAAPPPAAPAVAGPAPPVSRWRRRDFSPLPAHPVSRWRRRASSPRPPRPVSPWLRRAFSPVAWIVYAACALGVVALYALNPGLLPRPADVFFLQTPVRSVAALTLMTYALALAHEGCHWLAARAEGVRARITIGRRLYFLALEIDLSGLWSLPRRRRYGALLAGMAFDSVVLVGVLLARHGDTAGWWQLSEGAEGTLAAIAFVEVTALVSQCWIFLRTDLYAVLITATGCVNLLRVNQLLVRRTLRRITPQQRDELAAAPVRDLAIARWYRWVHALGMLAAAWFFVVLFAPATIQLLSWVGESVGRGDVGSVRFWEALAFGLVIVSPRLLTLAVAARDLRGWRERRTRNALARQAEPAPS